MNKSATPDTDLYLLVLLFLLLLFFCFTRGEKTSKLKVKENAPPEMQLPVTAA